MNTGDTVWTLACDLPAAKDTAGVYRTMTRTASECDAFAGDFQKRIPTEFDDISYYQEAAYYMDHGSEGGAHFLFVHYLDQGYEYMAMYDEDPVWAEADREIILQAFKKYPMEIPASAEFNIEGDGWHSFTLNQQMEGDLLYDGVLRIRYAEDGTVWEIENHLLPYTQYRDVAIISPEEALERLTAGKFHDEGLFEHIKPAQVSILECVLEYRVDTKGFYQPVYTFAVKSADESYRYRIVIPAIP